MEDGEGIPGVFPALAGSPAVQAGNADTLPHIVLSGEHAVKTKQTTAFMEGTRMTRFTKSLGTLAARAAVTAVLASGSAAALAAGGEMLSGKQEVPPVQSSASGTSNIAIKSDHSVSGGVETRGIEGTMAHIHHGASGKNGPPIVTLEKGADGKWMVPANTKLTDEQYKSYEAGDLYVNVHSDAHKNGEIRAQLKH